MSVGELVVSIIGDMSNLTSSFSKASSEVGNFGSNITSKVGSGLEAVGKAALVAGSAVGVGLIAAGAKATSMFEDFEKSVSNAASVTGKTGQAFKDAKANIAAVAEELGQKTSFSSSQAADALYNLASAGVDVSTITADKLVPILNLASGTQYDLASTTSAVTSTLSQFGLGFESAGRVADVFADSAALSQANMEKLNSSMSQVGTMANTAGLSLEDTTAALSEMYNAGMDGSTAGTGLKEVLASLLAPTSQATDVLKKMGLTVNDINPTTNKFSDIIQKLKDHGLDATSAFQLFGREGAPAISALTSHSEDLKTLTDQLKNAGGVAQTMATEQLDTLSGSLDALSGSIENMFINVGQALAPTIRSVADTLNGLIPQTQTFIVSIVTMFTTFLGQLAPAGKAILEIRNTIIEAFSAIIKSGSETNQTSGIATFINSLFAGIADLVKIAVPIVQAGVANIIDFMFGLISGLGPTWKSLSGIADQIATIFKNLFATLSGPVAQEAGAILSKVINSIVQTFEWLTGKISDVLGALTPVVTEIWKSLQGVFSNASTILTPAFDTVKQFLDNIRTAMLVFVSRLGPTWDSLGQIWTDLKKIFMDVSSALSPVLSTIGGKLSEFIGVLVSSSTAITVGRSLAIVVNTISEALSGLIKYLAENKTISNALSSIFSYKIPDSVWDTLSKVFETGKKIFTDFVNNLGPTWESLGKIWTDLKKIFTDVSTALSPVISTISGKFSEFIGVLTGSPTAVTVGESLANAVNTISKALSGLIKYLAENKTISNALSSIFSYKIPDSVWDTLSKVFETGKKIFTDFVNNLGPTWDSIKTSFETVKTIVQNFVDDLSPTWDNVKTSWDSAKKIFENFTPIFIALLTAFTGKDADDATTKGKALADVINLITGAIAGVLKFAADHPTITTMVIAVAGLAAAFVVLVPAIAGAITAISGVATTISVLVAALSTGGLGAFLLELSGVLFPAFTDALIVISGVALPALGTAFGIVSTAMGILVYTVIPILIEGLGLLITPIGLIAVALGLFVIAWTQNWFDIQGKAKTVWEWIKTEVGNLYNSLSSAYDKIASSVGTFCTNFKYYWDNAGKIIDDAKTKIGDSVQHLKDNLLTIYNNIKTDLTNFYNNNWVTPWNNFVDYLTTIKTNIGKKIDDVKNLISTKFSDLKTNLTDYYNNIWVANWNNFVDYLTTIKTNIGKKIDDIKTWVNQKWNDIKTTISTDIEQIKTTIENKINDFKNAGIKLVQGIIDGITSKASDLLNTAKSFMSDPIGTATNLVSGNSQNAGASIGSNVISGLQSKTPAAQSAGTSVASAAVSGTYSVSSSAQSSGSSLMQSFANGISSASGFVQGAVSRVLTSINNMLPHSPAKEGPFRVLPNWDAVFLDPIASSIKSMSGLVSPLQTNLQKLRGPLDSMLSDPLSGLSSGLGTLANVVQNADFSTHNYGGNTSTVNLNNAPGNIDLNQLVPLIMDAINRENNSQMRARGIQ